MRIRCHPSVVSRIPHCWKHLPVETQEFLPKRYIWRCHDPDESCPDRMADVFKLEDEEEDAGPVRRELDRMLLEIQQAIRMHQKNRDLPFQEKG